MQKGTVKISPHSKERWIKYNEKRDYAAFAYRIISKALNLIQLIERRKPEVQTDDNGKKSNYRH
jgi:hypothetical protein